MKTRMIKTFYITLLAVCFSGNIFAQVGINENGSDPDNSAMLDVSSNNKGFLFPRLTEAERNALPSPAKGLLIYNTTSSLFNYFDGSHWLQVETSSVSFSTGTTRPGGGISLNPAPDIPPDSSAMLDVNDHSRGILIPRTTTTLVTAPAKGLMIYNSSTNYLNYYDGTKWKGLCASSNGGTGATGSQAKIGLAVNATGSTIDQSAILDVSATNKGILIPRLTETQRNSLFPALGLTIYNLTFNTLEFFNGSGWYQLKINDIASPVAGTHVPALTQITWSWNIVPGATGYKWNTTDNYLTAEDMGTSTAKYETGLVCGTSYTRYIWAYGSCGPSNRTTTMQSTLSCPGFPSVTTNPITNITQNSATGGGNVTSDGGATVTAHGICWSTSSNPTTSGSHSTDGSGTGTFISSLTGLAQNTQYYVRAYATNGVGTAYGNQVTFSTLTIPAVTTNAVTNITQTTATCGGNVTSGGGTTVTARGVCWSTTANPTTSGSHTTDGSGTGTFVSNLSGLTFNTIYYVRAYATNIVGTAYGNQVNFTTADTTSSFICGSTLLDVRDGKTYSIVQIGTQCWMGQNLNIGTRINASNQQTNNNIIEKYCYSNLESNCDIYGGLYQWNEMMQYVTNEGANGICPSGSHIPTDAEWTILMDFLGGHTIAGGAMKETGFTHWASPNGGASNSSGFTGLPGGLRYDGYGYSSLTYNGYFWSSSQTDVTYAWKYWLQYGNAYLGRDSYYLKVYGFSVRCLKEIIPLVTTNLVTIVDTNNAVSGGNVITDGGKPVIARGVCWSSSPNPTTSNTHTADGSGTGLFVSNLSGLTTNTYYYVRAYATNSVGTSYGNQVGFNTSWTWSCGFPFLVNHVEGTIAPVNKSTVYSTVTNIAGEPSKCWITSNLGADHQASSSTDATEASAGWYWQFNRKQGYKHDGTTRTPNTTWTSISENLNWQSANDPCTLELGGGWRIPTKTEWENVKVSLGWTNRTGPWNSELKLHGAGRLNGATGSLEYRGDYGHEWTSTQRDGGAGWDLIFDNVTCDFYFNSKSMGMPLRCLKNPNPSVTTATVTNITQTTATSGGNVTSDGGATVTARGVCWSTSSNPTTSGSHTTDGSGTGTFISNLSGLVQNTLYYVRAYATNIAGTGYGNEISFTTTSGWTCGIPITINHIAGAVAPVDKTVTYGTVTNIPGESSKCWITSNLGADHQATAVNDATEPSAGWYWQFNRKQGYKHDGTTRTPNSTWISSIVEDLPWQAANDPCALEFGTGWRIPTNAEWTNVDASGGWTNWTGPWNSGLKLHAAGKLRYDGNGSLFYRGEFGMYWSNTQMGATFGWGLDFSSASSWPNPEYKADGYPLRCIKE
jgi:uncharacterized protein (TIGR02145 family)